MSVRAFEKHRVLWQSLTAMMAGLLFGAGLVVSQMINPAKVLAFLDIAGHWDPSLIFVMASAIPVAALGFRFVWEMQTPVLDDDFSRFDRRDITPGLIAGPIVFGMGWGLIGFCPGPATAALGTGKLEAVIFIGAMISGMLIQRAGARIINKERETKAAKAAETKPA